MQNATRNVAEQPLQVLVARKLYAPEEIPGPVAVVLEGTTIRDIWRGMDAPAVRRHLSEHIPEQHAHVVDLTAYDLAPGYIDLHTHGFGGYDVTTGTREEVEAMARLLPRTGVTAFFPTVATLDRANTVQQVRHITDAIEAQGCTSAAEMLGLRLEGPFISKAKKGAQYEQGIRPPDSTELETLALMGHGCIRIIDYAPEEDTSNGFLATVVRLGILACIGHTAATYEQALRAIDGGARHSTHLFNAMSGLNHRDPGVAGALLTDSRATVEIIADGVHMHPAIVKLALAARDWHDIALITDAISAAGLPEGDYEFVGRKISVINGAVRLEDGALAGSILTLDRAVRNIVAFTDMSWSQAITMATQIPARIANVAQRKGSITPGTDADLIALDEQGIVQYTWTHGQLAYQPVASSNGQINVTASLLTEGASS